ncbi:hypothetical protein I4U23_003250 [Adineta vaga]|nr:hypothetical protein I4U23_003250 [Adineta vaga]
MNICLLSTTKHFMPPEELRFWSISNLSVPTELYIIKIDGKSRQHHYLSVLLYVLNVDKIDIDNLNFIPINASLCDEIANRLQKSYFLQLLKFHKINQTDQIHRLDDIKFFEAERLEFYMNNANIFVGTTQVHVKSNCFYIVRPWNTEHVLAQLSEKICIFLQLPMISFKNHVEKLLIIESADRYFIQLGIPLVIEEIVNNATENRIKQTNLDLFNKLPSATPAELLLAGLKAQNSSWTGYVYHYTHLENAISIVCERSIKSRYQLTQLGNFKDSSSYDFMSHVHDEVNRYVRFYFRPRTLTQYHNENLGSGKCKKRNEYTPICPVPIFVRIDLQAILNIPNIQWKVSLGDMSRTRTIYDSTRDVIEQFDFDGVFKNDDAELNEYSIQLEFLIENELNFQLLPNDCIHLICQNRDAKTSLECVLKEQLMDTYSLQIDKNYFFEKNDRIFINHEQNQDHISVRMNSGNECPARGMFIVQINCSHQQETMELACKGNKICAAFHHDQLTTIYGREKSIDVLVGKQNYAVYYQYEGRIWLIYTNHCQYEFDKLHTEKYVEFALYD